MPIEQFLCGEVNLHDEAGTLIPHRFQLEAGKCAHSNPIEWSRCIDGVKGNYAGTVGPDRDEHWPVHLWVEEGTRFPRGAQKESLPPVDMDAMRVASARFVREPFVRTPQPLPPNAFARKPSYPTWPEHDPKPEVSTLDPRPRGVKVPASVAALAGEVDGIRFGYSRVLLRGVKLGTYRRVEMWGVWFPPATLRPYARYERFADKREVLRWDPKTNEFGTEVPAAGTPGTWKWTRVTVGDRVMTITELKEYLS